MINTVGLRQAGPKGLQAPGVAGQGHPLQAAGGHQGRAFQRLNQSSNLKCRPPGQSNHRSVVSFVKLYFQLKLQYQFHSQDTHCQHLHWLTSPQALVSTGGSHQLPGNLQASAGGGAQVGDGDGVLLKHAGPGEANLNLLPYILIPRLACLVVLRPSSAELD